MQNKNKQIGAPTIRFRSIRFNDCLYRIRQTPVHSTTKSNHFCPSTTESNHKLEHNIEGSTDHDILHVQHNYDQCFINALSMKGSSRATSKGYHQFSHSSHIKKTHSNVKINSTNNNNFTTKCLHSPHPTSHHLSSPTQDP